MQYFLKMQSEKIWNVVEFGQSLPKVLDREGKLTNVIKPKLECDRSENEGTSQVFREGLVGLSQVKPCTQFFILHSGVFNR